MTSRLSATILLLAFAFVGLPLVSAQPKGEAAPAIDTSIFPYAKGNWDLKALDGDPVKLVSINYVARPRLRQAEFVLEFTRDLTVRDTDWSGVRPEPPFRFDFEDKDGVTVLSLRPTYAGVPIMLKGRRVRVVVSFPPLPPPDQLDTLSETDRERLFFLSQAKKVVVDLKPYGS